MRLLKIYGPGDVRLDSYERPNAGPKDVVVRMKACGICGSDLSEYRSQRPICQVFSLQFYSVLNPLSAFVNTLLLGSFYNNQGEFDERT